MICPPCKTAGRLLRATGENAAQAARVYHGQCEAASTWDERPDTCTCQHEIAPVEQIVAPNALRKDHPKEAGND